MATIHHPRTGADPDGRSPAEKIPSPGPRLTTERVWHRLDKATFAIVSHVTPAGEPRSSGVVFRTAGSRLFVATAPDSWKARHLAANGAVAVTVPIRRGGLLALVAPIPPATITFHGVAVVLPPGTALPRELARLMPPERRAGCALIEIVPEGVFLVYGLGVPLMKMRSPEASLTRVPVTSDDVPPPRPHPLATLTEPPPADDTTP